MYSCSEALSHFSSNRKIEDTSFSFKTALSEANDKTNVMATTKWTYHEDWSFASNYFIFFGKLVSVLEPLKKS